MTENDVAGELIAAWFLITITRMWLAHRRAIKNPPNRKTAPKEAGDG